MAKLTLSFLLASGAVFAAIYAGVSLDTRIIPGAFGGMYVAILLAWNAGFNAHRRIVEEGIERQALSEGNSK